MSSGTAGSGGKVTTFLAGLFKPKDELTQDLDFVAACDDEVESEEIKQKMARIKMRIEPGYRLEERATTMKYIQEAIYDTKSWRRVYNGLRLLERVMQIAVLAEEQREGRHFDVVQQCALLMAFSHEDKRVTHLVRKRAQHVRETALQVLNVVADDSSGGATRGASSGAGDPLSTAESASISSTGRGGASSSTSCTPRPHVDLLSADPSKQSPSPNTPISDPPGSRGSTNSGIYANFYQSDKRGAALTSATGSTICYTKHREDTDSEEEGDHNVRAPPAAYSYNQSNQGPVRGNNMASSGTSVDLLDAMEDSAPSGGALPPPVSSAPTVTNLIDLL
ncbi:unnamed protein product [Amoebophrya sp. A25]|nr:unnamed protein product [Amoebophrya sp. A25]|eukprot:GSA25T00000272001.1